MLALDGNSSALLLCDFTRPTMAKGIDNQPLNSGKLTPIRNKKISHCYGLETTIAKYPLRFPNVIVKFLFSDVWQYILASRLKTIITALSIQCVFQIL